MLSPVFVSNTSVTKMHYLSLLEGKEGREEEKKMASGKRKASVRRDEKGEEEAGKGRGRERGRDRKEGRVRGVQHTRSCVEAKWLEHD